MKEAIEKPCVSSQETAIFKIKLIDQRFHSLIGLYPEERIEGNDMVVDLWVEFPATRFKSEELSTGISYADMYDIVKEEMDKEWLLLESIAIEIMDRMKGRWPFILHGWIRIEKVNPPIEGMKGICGIEYKF